MRLGGHYMSDKFCVLSLAPAAAYLIRMLYDALIDCYRRRLMRKRLMSEAGHGAAVVVAAAGHIKLIGPFGRSVSQSGSRGVVKSRLAARSE